MSRPWQLKGPQLPRQPLLRKLMGPRLLPRLLGKLEHSRCYLCTRLPPLRLDSEVKFLHPTVYHRVEGQDGLPATSGRKSGSWERRRPNSPPAKEKESCERCRDLLGWRRGLPR